MREIERIDRIVELIRALWKLSPDMRFGQLLENYIFEKPEALYRQEDDFTEKKLKEVVSGVKNTIKNK